MLLMNLWNGRVIMDKFLEINPTFEDYISNINDVFTELKYMRNYYWYDTYEFEWLKYYDEEMSVHDVTKLFLTATQGEM